MAKNQVRGAGKQVDDPARGAAGYSVNFDKTREQEAAKADARAAEPPRNADGLRTDGPTIEEWIRRNYTPQDYPPPGYAPVGTPGWAAEAARRGLTTGANPVPPAAPPVDDRRQNDPRELTPEEQLALKQTEELAGVPEQRQGETAGAGDAATTGIAQE